MRPVAVVGPVWARKPCHGGSVALAVCGHDLFGPVADSDDPSELGERGCEPERRRDVGRELVVTPAEVLH